MLNNFRTRSFTGIALRWLALSWLVLALLLTACSNDTATSAMYMYMPTPQKVASTNVASVVHISEVTVAATPSSNYTKRYTYKLNSDGTATRNYQQFETGSDGTTKEEATSCSGEQALKFDVNSFKPIVDAAQQANLYAQATNVGTPEGLSLVFGDGKTVGVASDNFAIQDAAADIFGTFNYKTKNSSCYNAPPITKPNPTGHTSFISQIAFSSDSSQIITVGGDNTVRVWDRKNLKLLKMLRLEGFNGLSFTKDGKTLAILFNNKINIWDIDTGKITKSLVGDGSVAEYKDIAFSPDGSTIVAGGAGNKAPMITKWDVTSGKLIATVSVTTGGYHPSNTLENLVYSPAGDTIAIASDVNLAVLEASTLKTVFYTLIASYLDIALAFDKKGSSLATGDLEGNVRIRALKDGKILVKALDAPPAMQRVHDLQFTYDGMLIISRNGTVKSFNPQTNQIFEITGFSYTDTTAIGVSPDNQTIALGLYDGSITLANSPSGSWSSPNGLTFSTIPKGGN